MAPVALIASFTFGGGVGEASLLKGAQAGRLRADKVVMKIEGQYVE